MQCRRHDQINDSPQSDAERTPHHIECASRLVFFVLQAAQATTERTTCECCIQAGRWLDCLNDEYALSAADISLGQSILQHLMALQMTLRCLAVECFVGVTAEVKPLNCVYETPKIIPRSSLFSLVQLTFLTHVRVNYMGQMRDIAFLPRSLTSSSVYNASAKADDRLF